MTARTVILLASLIGGLVIYGYAVEGALPAKVVPDQVEHTATSSTPSQPGWAATGHALYAN